MEVYGNVAKEVAPKRERLRQAQIDLEKKKKDLQNAQKQLADVLTKVKSLRERYEDSTANKKALEDELTALEGKLDRAHRLVTGKCLVARNCNDEMLSGLAGERSRWEISVHELETRIDKLPGDVALATAFMSYCGPFPSEYRAELVHKLWIPIVQKEKIPSSESFDFASFMADPSSVRDWNLQGLPADSFSTENGVMVTRSICSCRRNLQQLTVNRSRRWPLMIDPQAQGNQWIQSKERANGLIVLNLGMSDLIRQLESAIQFGNPVLLEDIKEELEPMLDPLLSKSFIRKGSQLVVRLGDKEIDFNSDFRFYITTKLTSPHYTPEISTKVMIVNCAVKLEGLQAQLLNTVVKHEQSDLYNQKNDLVIKVAKGKRTQNELEDQILELLSSASGSLLDNVELIDALDQSKRTYEEVNEALKVAESTALEIDQASKQYEACAVRAAILFFVLNGLRAIDPMYQFSLESYTELFDLSLRQSPKKDVISQRIEALNDYHTYAFYKYTTRGLFENHKLLLSLQMAFEILENDRKLTSQEIQIFLRGAPKVEMSDCVSNPAKDWMDDYTWEEIARLQLQASFHSLTDDIAQRTEEWEMWFRANQPEKCALPSEWEQNCSLFQKLILIKIFRPDRVLFAATNYVNAVLGSKYTQPPVLDLRETYMDSTSLTPLIFVLSPGVDPTDNLRKLAREMSMEEKLSVVALGQGQASLARRLIEEGIEKGHWVFLANCHLMTSWLSTLEEIVKDLERQEPHEDFRLWLSSSRSPLFPMSILQRGIKMTTEPPKGLRANLFRLYSSMEPDHTTLPKKQKEYQKLLFALAYFHSILLERRKFRFLGLNIPYDFNDTDFQVSDDLLRTYIQSYNQIPWDALRYLIAEANYGGRVTDELDRRVLESYISNYYCDKAVQNNQYKLSSLDAYYIPDDGTIASALEYVEGLPLVDAPEAFGQHPNAEIIYLKEDSQSLVKDLCQLQPQTASNNHGTRVEDMVRMIAEEVVNDLPSLFDLPMVMKKKAEDASPLHVFLFQEIERYNGLLRIVRHSCEELIGGIQGLVVISNDIEEIFLALQESRIPDAWLKTYASVKPLGQWKRDLLQRLEHLQKWIDEGYPAVYWMSGFTSPSRFVTAILQTYSREKSLPVDILSFEVHALKEPVNEIKSAPDEGVYVHGVLLEGAGWDFEKSCLCEPNSMELYVSMPVLWIKPVESRKRCGKRFFSCPLYVNGVRCGTPKHSSFVTKIELDSGSKDKSYWTLRGTALLLS